jgi:4-amino-4-deoxy-L-arabinose transferase-like glycosyltransferase
MRTTRFHSFAAVLAATLVLVPVAARAQCDADTEARLEFIESNLEANQPREKLWWGSWMAVFSVGAAYGITAGALEDNNEQAAASYVTAAKATLGIVDLVVRPHVGRHGAAPIRAIPKTSSASCAERLRVAEQTLEKAGDMSSMRWSWKRHLSSLVLNVGAAVAIAEGADEPERAWQDFAISEISSEVHIWTHPTKNAAAWADYRQKFSGAPAATAPRSFDFAFHRGGLGFVYKF